MSIRIFKIPSILLLSLLALSMYSQARKTIVISTKLPIKFRAYIDGELQIYQDLTNVKIANVPSGKKMLHVKVMTPSHQVPSIAIAMSDKKVEHYIITSENNKYYLKLNPNWQKEDIIYYTRAAYIRKGLPPAVGASVAATSHFCQLSDSTLHSIITSMAELKDPAAKKSYIMNVTKNYCLASHQLRSIGYRIDDDATRLEIYQEKYNSIIDKPKYLDLTNSFQSQVFGNKFIEWVKNQKL